MTLTKLPPRTMFDGRSMIEERASPRKSDETSGSSQAPRMPLSGPAAASRNAWLSSSTVTSFSSSAVKSTTETVGVGTRRLKPSNLPLSSGMTRARAFAAPVVVGMMFRRGGAGAARVLVGDVEDPLVVGVAVDRVHQAALDDPVVVDDLRRRRQAVRGAGGVADDVVLRRVVLVLVHAEDDRDVLLLGGGADDDLLRAGVDVGRGLRRRR